MPRMPTADSLGMNLPQSQAIPRQQQDMVGEASRALGGAVARMGETITQENQANIDNQRQIDIRQKEQGDALDLTRARTDWNKRRLTEENQYQLENNPDYANWGKTFQGNIEKHRQASASLIRSPSLRARFEAETQDDVTQGALTIQNRAQGIDKDLRVTTAINGLDDSISAAAAPGTDPKTADKILGQARANIDNMVATGVIDPAKGVELRRGLAQKYAKLRIDQDIQNDPNAAAAWLEGGQGGVEGLIRKQEGFRTTAYFDKDKYRVGFGSDTITTADGQVIPVKPGMTVTRADAERDLQRRIGEFQSGIVQDVGPGPWASLPPAAKAALTSVAYNYGSLPGRVVNAIKSGDIAQISEAVRGLSKDNGGINARRRNEEADIIAGGGDQIASLNQPDYYKVLDGTDRLALQTNADSEIAQRQKQQRETTALDRYNVKSAMDDDIAQIKATGQGTKLDPQTIINTLGEDDAAKWLEKRKTAVATYGAVTAMETMNNDQIEEHLKTLKPAAGATDFSSQQEIYDAAEKRANQLQDLRLKDPAKSVEDSPIVKKAKETYDPTKPDSIQALIKARLAAQAEVGIPDGIQQPITRTDAREIIKPVEKIIDESDARLVMAMSKAKTPEERQAARKAIRQATETAVRDTINHVDEIYGPYAQQVLAFAISESVRDKQVGDITAGIIRKTAQGITPTVAETQGLEHAVEASTAEKAMNGELPPAATTPAAAPAAPAQPQRPAQPARVPPIRSGTMSVPMKLRPPPGGWPFVDEASVRALIANPSLADAFDQRFGTGEAEKWLPKTPAGVQ